MFDDAKVKPHRLHPIMSIRSISSSWQSSAMRVSLADNALSGLLKTVSVPVARPWIALLSGSDPLRCDCLGSDQRLRFPRTSSHGPVEGALPKPYLPRHPSFVSHVHVGADPELTCRWSWPLVKTAWHKPVWPHAVYQSPAVQPCCQGSLSTSSTRRTLVCEPERDGTKNTRKGCVNHQLCRSARCCWLGMPAMPAEMRKAMFSRCRSFLLPAKDVLPCTVLPNVGGRWRHHAVLRPVRYG